MIMNIQSCILNSRVKDVVGCIKKLIMMTKMVTVSKGERWATLMGWNGDNFSNVLV